MVDQFHEILEETMFQLPNLSIKYQTSANKSRRKMAVEGENMKMNYLNSKRMRGGVIVFSPWLKTYQI